ncbi:universal stress protein [Amycolatopsis panacis]|uniref:Universal stress protein n=1 Tax=Amycolatopsis panacis TaxID=2340917 RepID=A0A419I6U9_9PSEU|nr:universal stress protein [Amycolatopsis panacis]RJQ87261.1 universal stress protein [Amycolatopsis panacis]
MTKKNTVLAGVDGSDAGRAALTWAIDWATRTGAEVDAVTAWLYDPMLDDPSLHRTKVEARRIHLRELEDQVAAARPGVVVRCAVPDGDAADVLVDLSRDAQLLVVGSHGKGKWRNLLVGSVSATCLRRAHCPVVVVPPRAWMPGGLVGQLLAGTPRPAPRE